MSSSVLAALTILLPSLSPSFPPRLLSQCDSLLALSRQRAAHLKPEEEIARAHACCEIACDRLRAQLRLPAPKTVGAPCKPSVYKRLKAFLEGVLGDAGTPRTPKKRDANGDLKTPTSARSRPTPTPQHVRSAGKEKSGFVGKIKASSTRAAGYEDEAEAPRYVIQSIRKLCNAFKTQVMVPHVYTATCIGIKRAALGPSNEAQSMEAEEESKGEIQALVIAMYFLVLTRMQSAITKETWAELSKKALQVLGMEEERREDVERFVFRINEENWTKEGEWWDSIPEAVLDPVQLSEDGNMGKEHSEETQTRRIRQRLKEAEEDRDDVLLPGLGTMMSDATDWTSDERRADFALWNKDILKRMAVMDQSELKQARSIRVAA